MISEMIIPHVNTKFCQRELFCIVILSQNVDQNNIF